MTHTFEVRERDDETQILVMDGDELIYLSHDTDGWSGMERARNLFLNIADRLGCEVVYTYEDEN